MYNANVLVGGFSPNWVPILPMRQQTWRSVRRKDL